VSFDIYFKQLAFKASVAEESTAASVFDDTAYSNTAFVVEEQAK